MFDLKMPNIRKVFKGLYGVGVLHPSQSVLSVHLNLFLSKRVFKNGIPLDGGYLWMVDTSKMAYLWMVDISLIGFGMSFPQWYLNEIYGPYNFSLLKFLLFSLIIIAMTFYLA